MNIFVINKSTVAAAARIQNWLPASRRGSSLPL